MLVCGDSDFSSENPSWVLFLACRDPSHRTEGHLPTLRNPPVRIEHRVTVRANVNPGW